MSDSLRDVEDRILSALDDIHDQLYPNAVKAAEAYGVNVRTLQRHVKGGASQFTRPATNRALNLAQEQVLFEYIERLDKIDMSPKPGMLRSSANYILQLADPGTERRVGLN